MVPKIRKSLNACTLLRSSGRWHWVTIVVAPMKAKFQPTPSSISAVQKCATVMPASPTSALDAAINASPAEDDPLDPEPQDQARR